MKNNHTYCELLRAILNGCTLRYQGGLIIEPQCLGFNEICLNFMGKNEGKWNTSVFLEEIQNKPYNFLIVDCNNKSLSNNYTILSDDNSNYSIIIDTNYLNLANELI